MKKNFIQKITSKLKPGFWLYFTIYALVLFIAAMVFLIYTENSLVKYEKSQAESIVEGYANALKESALSEELPQGLSVPTLYKQFSLEEEFVADFCAQFSKDTKMKFGKQKDSYDTSMPVFDIYADDIKVAEIQMKATNSRNIFAILTISDWAIVSYTPIVEQYAQDSIAITVLSTHEVAVNGVVLDSSYVKKQNVEIAEFASFKDYLASPVQLTEYALPNSLAQGEIQITAADGTKVSYTPDTEGNIYVDYIEYAPQVPSDYSTTAMNIAKTWDNFLTGDLPGNGLSSVQKYLIKDSPYDEQARIFAANDAWMVSSHNTAANTYLDTSIGDYVQYSEDCFSCHIKFTKKMILSRTGEDAFTYIDSVFYFVNYDDTDDGVNNPSWRMVAMASPIQTD